MLPRILNLQRSQLCYIVGTVYLDMPLKPNVLEDMARNVSLVHLGEGLNLTRSTGSLLQLLGPNSTLLKTQFISRMSPAEFAWSGK